jgi:hypothetical protein
LKLRETASQEPRSTSGINVMSLPSMITGDHCAVCKDLLTVCTVKVQVPKDLSTDAGFCEVAQVLQRVALGPPNSYGTPNSVACDVDVRNQ